MLTLSSDDEFVGIYGTVGRVSEGRFSDNCNGDRLKSRGMSGSFDTFGEFGQIAQIVYDETTTVSCGDFGFDIQKTEPDTRHHKPRRLTLAACPSCDDGFVLTT